MLAMLIHFRFCSIVKLSKQVNSCLKKKKKKKNTAQKRVEYINGSKFYFKNSYDSSNSISYKTAFLLVGFISSSLEIIKCRNNGTMTLERIVFFSLACH